MATTQYGTKLNIGVGTAGITIPNSVNYVLESQELNGDVDMEITNDANGAPYNICVYNQFPTVTLNLICLAAAAPTTDFPEGTVIDSTWYINSAPVVKTKSPHRVSVSLTNIGIS